MGARALKQRVINKIGAMEMRIYKKILNISWTDRVSNEEVLKRINKEREIVVYIKQQKLQ